MEISIEENLLPWELVGTRMEVDQKSEIMWRAPLGTLGAVIVGVTDELFALLDTSLRRQSPPRPCNVGVTDTLEHHPIAPSARWCERIICTHKINTKGQPDCKLRHDATFAPSRNLDPLAMCL